MPMPRFDGVAWEKEGNVVSRFVATTRQLLTQSPQLFFSLGASTEQPADVSRAENFAYLASFIGLAGAFTTQVLLGGPFAQYFAWALAFTPLLAMMPAHLLAGLYHLPVLVFVREPKSYDVTFRIIAYGMAPLALMAVPPIGPLLAPGWILALHWVGLAAGHRMPLGSALLVMLLPLSTLGILTLRIVAFVLAKHP